MKRSPRKRSDPFPTIIMSFASLGAYRQRTMKAVKDHFGSDLEIFAGDRAPDLAIRLVEPDGLVHTRLRNRYFKGDILLQNISFVRYLKCNILLLDLNPRMPQVWLLLVCRRLLGMRTILWGHAWPRAGANSRSDSLRGAMRRLSTSILTYTGTQARELSMKHPHHTITAAPNAFYFEREFVFDADAVRDSVICVGRLLAEKKPVLLVEAFERLHVSNPHIRLVIVGDGAEYQRTKEAVGRSSAGAQIEMLGHVSDYESLRQLYSRAIVSVCPGTAGLSFTQSLSFGTPMLISRDEPHGPELEAAREGENCAFFETDQPASLANGLEAFVAHHLEWAELGQQISQHCADEYSVERMVSGIIHAVESERR